MLLCAQAFSTVERENKFQSQVDILSTKIREIRNADRSIRDPELVCNRKMIG